MTTRLECLALLALLRSRLASLSRGFVGGLCALAFFAFVVPTTTAACSKKEQEPPTTAAADAKPVVTPPADAAALPMAKDAGAKAVTPDAAASLDAAMASKPPPKETPVATKDNTPKNLKVLPKTWSAKRLGKEMQAYSKALGVKCKHCHVDGDFASDKKKSKIAARKMITMTNSMNAKYFKGAKTKLSCMTCHKGKAKI